MIEKFINDEYNSRHVGYESPPLDLTLENFVETLVNTVQDLCQDELVIVSQANYEDSHITVAPKDCHIVLQCHDIVFDR